MLHGTLHQLHAVIMMQYMEDVTPLIILWFDHTHQHYA